MLEIKIYCGRGYRLQIAVHRVLLNLIQWNILRQNWHRLWLFYEFDSAMFISWIGCIWNIWKSHHYYFTSHSKTQKSRWRFSAESGLWLKSFAILVTTFWILVTECSNLSDISKTTVIDKTERTVHLVSAWYESVTKIYKASPIFQIVNESSATFSRSP